MINGRFLFSFLAIVILFVPTVVLAQQRFNPMALFKEVTPLVACSSAD